MPVYHIEFYAHKTHEDYLPKCSHYISLPDHPCSYTIMPIDITLNYLFNLNFTEFPGCSLSSSLRHMEHKKGLSPEVITAALQEKGYIAKECVGSGSYGNVYLVHSDRWGQDFVCKVTKMPENRARGMIEIQALMKIYHPNVVAMYDYFEYDGFVFLILEYCPGGSLQQEIARSSGLPNEKVVDYALQLTSAVIACHMANIAHRDIKPANVLIDKYGRLKLADFGLARDMESEEKGPVFAGSRAYMPPEMFNMKVRSPYLCDVWSLAVTFCVMTNNVLPWGTADLEKNIKSGMLPSVRYVSREFTKMVKAMLNQNPEKRLPLAQAEQVLLAEKDKLGAEKKGMIPSTESMPGKLKLFVNPPQTASFAATSPKALIARPMQVNGARVFVKRRVSATPVWTFTKNVE